MALALPAGVSGRGTWICTLGMTQWSVLIFSYLSIFTQITASSLQCRGRVCTVGGRRKAQGGACLCSFAAGVAAAAAAAARGPQRKGPREAGSCWGCRNPGAGQPRPCGADPDTLKKEMPRKKRGDTNPQRSLKWKLKCYFKITLKNIQGKKKGESH